MANEKYIFPVIITIANNKVGKALTDAGSLTGPYAVASGTLSNADITIQLYKTNTFKKIASGDSLTFSVNTINEVLYYKALASTNVAVTFVSTPVLATQIIVAAPSNDTSLVAGATAQLTATVLPTNVSSTDIVWSTVSGTGSTISATGLVTAGAEADSTGTVFKASAIDGSLVYGTITITVVAA